MANTTATPVAAPAVAAPAVPAVPVNPVTGTTMSPEDRETQLRLQILEAELEEARASAEVAKTEAIRRKAEVARIATGIATIASIAGYIIYGTERADKRAQAKKSFWKK